MRKRSKKRIPQDVRPWVRVKENTNDVLQVPGKKTTRWVAGGRRDWNTKILNAVAVAETNNILLKSVSTYLGQYTTDFSINLISKLNCRAHSSSKMRSASKYKNYCLISGRGRTYNRNLYLARHNMRKLVGVGLISGLVK